MEINIKNIVFFIDEDTNERKACVFYTDGTDAIISYEDGKKAAAEIAIENKMTLNDLRNNDIICFEKTKKAVNEKYHMTSTVVKEAMPAITILNKDDYKVVKAAKTEKKQRFSLKTKIAAAAVAGLVAVSAKFGLPIDKVSAYAKNMNNSTTTEETTEELVSDNNDYYDSYTYEELLEVTNNQSQKAEMKRIHDALYGYNVTFAENYLEEDKDIRAALNFDEVVALSQAYNDFTPEEISAIFNGQAIKASDLDGAYKSATLQLMGAHVIETREHPVDMSGIIISEEGKAFYEKYHNLFLNAKEATGDEKIAAVEAFYNEVRNDFPIDPDTREVGISHSSSHQSIESYKLAITPMVAAGEIMWQNLDIDHTLQGGVNAYFFGDVDITELSNEELVEIILNGNVGVSNGEIDYFNDLGLCNIANDKFEIVQQITMGNLSNSDKTNPRYDQYRNAIIKELTDKNAYVIDDAHRELSELDRFQDEVNWHFELDEDGYYTGSVYYTTKTYTRTKTWKKTKTTKKTVITREEKEIPDDEKEKIDKEIEEENKETKEEAEKEAEETRQDMQKEEDKKAEEIQKEIEEEEKDLQDKIDEANDKIEHNQEIDQQQESQQTENTTTENTTTESEQTTTPVNEADFGDHNVVFEDEHKDDQGNLNDSVEHITTDSSDVKTEDDLPDPNETGKKFDEEGEKQAKQTTSKSESSSNSSSASTATTSSKSAREEAIDNYVEAMANTSDADEDAKELSK